MRINGHSVVPQAPRHLSRLRAKATLLQTKERLDRHVSELLSLTCDNGPLLNLPHEVNLRAGRELALTWCVCCGALAYALGSDQNMRRDLGDGLRICNYGHGSEPYP